MSFQNKFNHWRLVEATVLFLVSALTYLPNLLKATIYRDDWYYVMDRLIGGAAVFPEMFSIDRPIRGPLFELYYQLFGIQPISYHLSSFLWRFLGGLAALWLFNILWPKQRRAAFFMALLFTLFPGYTRWMEGFEDLPRILSSFLMVLSIALTLQAIKTNTIALKIAAWLGAILTGWAYIALLDFAIGMEAFRLLCVFLLVSQGQQNLTLVKKGILTVRAWAIAVLIPACFLFWRLFFFHGTRKQTDIGVQLGSFVSAPLMTGAWWLIRLLQSAINVAFLSWGSGPFQSIFVLSLGEIVIGGALAVISLAIVLFANRILPKEKDADPENVPDISGDWQVQAIWVGLIGVVAGVVPVVMANRYADFTSYSHYALPASLAGAMLLVGLVSFIPSSRIRLSVFSALVVLAVSTHYAVSTQIVTEENKISAFWQQVAWRAPGIKEGTTLLVNYPGLDYGENIDTVTGPANFIYYPEPTNQIPVTYKLYAVLQTAVTTKDILAQKDRMDGYRTHVGAVNFDRLLVISQPSDAACVHVMDGRWPLFSTDDNDQTLLAGARSRVDTILTDKESPKLSASIFGAEPAHKWCYYFQKADLARQMGNWKEVAKLGDEAIRLGYHPIDLTEWTPFLQAYAYLGDWEAFKVIVPKIKLPVFVKLQACAALNEMLKPGYSFDKQVQTQMEKLCGQSASRILDVQASTH